MAPRCLEGHRREHGRRRFFALARDTVSWFSARHKPQNRPNLLLTLGISAEKHGSETETYSSAESGASSCASGTYLTSMKSTSPSVSGSDFWKNEAGSIVCTSTNFGVYLSGPARARDSAPVVFWHWASWPGSPHRTPSHDVCQDTASTNHGGQCRTSSSCTSCTF